MTGFLIAICDLPLCSGSSESEFVDKRNSQTTSYFILVFSNIWCWSRVHCINELMCFGLDDVFMIRICGMSGIGKTTLAKAAYNESAHLFEGTCFLENFGELLKKRFIFSDYFFLIS